MPDFFDLSRHFTAEERAVQRHRARVRRRAASSPTSATTARRAPSPTELIPEIAELGLLGCNLQGYGCAGLSEIGYGLAMQELERGDSGVRRFASVQGSLVMYPIHAFGSEEQKERYLPEDGEGRDHRLLRPHRAGLRLEPERACAPSRATTATRTS